MFSFNLEGDSPEIVLEKHISVKAAAEFSGYSIQYLRRLLRNDRLEGIKIGQVWLIEMDSFAESRAITAEQRFAAAGDLFARLFAEEKRQRILAASERWPELPAASIAIIAGASPGYVSEVLNDGDGR